MAPRDGDTFNGGDGNDVLNGGLGADTMDGGPSTPPGGDECYGGRGNDSGVNCETLSLGLQP